MRAWGIKSSASFLIRLQVIRSFWLRRCSERRQRLVTWCRNVLSICRDRMVFKEAGYDLPQPFSLFGEWLVPTSSHFLLNFLELRSHAVAAGFSLQGEAP